MPNTLMVSSLQITVSQSVCCRLVSGFLLLLLFIMQFCKTVDTEAADTPVCVLAVVEDLSRCKQLKSVYISDARAGDGRRIFVSYRKLRSQTATWYDS